MEFLFASPSEDFAGGFLVGVVAAGLLSLFLRWVLRPGGEPEPRQLDLRPLEVAYLVNGPKGAVEAALTALVRRRSLTFLPGDRAVRATGGAPGSDPLERALLERCVAGDLSLEDAMAASTGACAELQTRLQELRLLLSEGHRIMVKLVALTPLLLLEYVGVTWLQMGHFHLRPQKSVLTFCFLIVVGAVAMVLLPLRRTRTADRVLAAFRARYQTVLEALTKGGSVEALSPDEWVLCSTLFGFGFLAGTEAEALHVAIYADPRVPIDAPEG